jgi:hypothetical protein
MKSKALLLAAGLWTLPAAAPAETNARAEMVEIEVRFVQATKTQAAEIPTPELNFPNPSGPRIPPELLAVSGVFSAEQASVALARLKKAGAEIASVPRIIALDGRRATVQNVREFRYPSEYSKPDASGKVVPIAFETVPIGIVLEFEPKMGPAETIDLIIAAGIKELTGYADYTGRQGSNQTTDKRSATSPVWQPIIKAREVTTEVTVLSGQTVLLSGTAETDKDRAQFIFITAREAGSQ